MGSLDRPAGPVEGELIVDGQDVVLDVPGQFKNRLIPVTVERIPIMDPTPEHPHGRPGATSDTHYFRGEPLTKGGVAVGRVIVDRTFDGAMILQYEVPGLVDHWGNNVKKGGRLHKPGTFADVLAKQGGLFVYSDWRQQEQRPTGATRNDSAAEAKARIVRMVDQLRRDGGWKCLGGYHVTAPVKASDVLAIDTKWSPQRLFVIYSEAGPEGVTINVGGVGRSGIRMDDSGRFDYPALLIRPIDATNYTLTFAARHIQGSPEGRRHPSLRC